MISFLWAFGASFNRGAIMRRAHALRVKWRAARDAGEPGWTAATPETNREDMGLALKRAWRMAKAEKQAIADAVYWTRRAATEAPVNREIRLAALASQCNRESLANAGRTAFRFAA